MPVIMLRDLEHIDEWLKILEKIIAKNRESLSKKDFKSANKSMAELKKLVRGILY